jgi:molybdenum cofactor guanylyltransferase
MKILGALLAGGQSIRFNGDKALHHIDGIALIAHSLSALKAQCDDVIICGRSWGGLTQITDIPNENGGPLCGINAALRHAQINGFDGVLSSSIDVYPLPQNLVSLLVGSRPAAFKNQHLIAWWPVEQASALDAFVSAGNRAVYKWLIASNALHVEDPIGLVNINTIDDLRLIR